MLTEFAPREATFKAKLLNGRTVEVTLRPFTLRDHAWMQRQFTTEAEHLAIANMNVEPLARIIWNQMDAKSQAIFQQLQFNVSELQDHDRLLEALDGFEGLLAGMRAFSECRGQNDFIPEPAGAKKKPNLLQTLMNGLKFMTWSPKSTA